MYQTTGPRRASQPRCITSFNWNFRNKFEYPKLKILIFQRLKKNRIFAVIRLRARTRRSLAAGYAGFFVRLISGKTTSFDSGAIIALSYSNYGKHREAGEVCRLDFRYLYFRLRIVASRNFR